MNTVVPDDAGADDAGADDAGADDAGADDARCAALYAALLGERLSTDSLVRHWLSLSDGAAMVCEVLEFLPQPGGLESLERIDAERHGPNGPVRADWPPPLRVMGTVRYVAMVALALHEHGVWRSSRPASELDPVAAAMLPIVPEPWRVVLGALRARAQVV